MAFLNGIGDHAAAGDDAADNMLYELYTARMEGFVTRSRDDVEAKLVKNQTQGTRVHRRSYSPLGLPRNKEGEVEQAGVVRMVV